MAIEEEPDAGIPEWVVTFGDMMSLLLTFFIMLVSLSEMKQDEKFQAMVESFHQQFGHDRSISSMMPGEAKPRNSQLAKLATMGRAKRFNTMKGGDKVNAPVGDHPRVEIVRPGSRTAIGTMIQFPEHSAELNEENKRDLQRQVAVMGGKPQKIEVRGHTSPKPVRDNPKFRDNWDLAYQRARNVMDFLIELGIDPRRIRMSVAGSNEPLDLGTNAANLIRNPRVEIYMLDEVVADLEGEEDQRDARFTEENDP